MSIREQTAILTSRGPVYVCAATSGMQPLPAEIDTGEVAYLLERNEAHALAAAIAPDLAPEQVKEDLLKPYQDNAKAAHADLTETVESWTRELNAARASNWEGHQLADSMENLLLALSPVLVTLREIKDGDL